MSLYLTEVIINGEATTPIDYISREVSLKDYIQSKLEVTAPGREVNK